MNTLNRRAALKTLGGSALLAGAPLAWAQEQYPSRTIKLIAPFAAGGGSDSFARRIVPFLGEGMADQMIVENKPGGNSILATMAVVQAPPDGYTILLQQSTIIVNPFLQKDLPYDRERDLAPISLVARTPHALVVSNTLPVKSVKELVEYAKANPGKLNFGTGGIGTNNHLAAELLMKAAGIKMEHVAYKGASEFVRDLIPGLLHIGFPGAEQAATLAKQGSVKVLAVTSAKRSSLLPDTPTLAELGYPSVELYSWTGFFAPIKTPKEIVQKLARAFQAATRNPKFRELTPSYELLSTTPEQFADFLKKEHAQTAILLKNVDLSAASAPKR
ncbi:MAG TPA: tripartite tricarboxylate transporter substrate binding protein [Ramlibacter sp.]|nr:tripartite tricarboxylate transporter substrate binding protein [Ramlibacter sp.]